jgi:tetratricopeptide (TPR) repeat protein
MLAWAPTPVVAHDGPRRVIEIVGRAIATEGPSAQLLLRRAYEHQALGDTEAAILDFNAALAFDPRSTAAWLGGAEARLRRGEWQDAASMARAGLELDPDARTQAPFHALLARIHESRRQWTMALDAWRSALRAPQGEIDWFLGEARCLAELGRTRERCEALTFAMTRNPSVVLRRAWIHALVEAGDLDLAWREIETALGDARWKSAWLLLRARIHAQRGDRPQQRSDASAALEEITIRLHPTRPDPQLLAEAEFARRLLRE